MAFEFIKEVVLVPFIANVTKGLEKKPVLLIHFLIALTCALLVLYAVRSLLTCCGLYQQIPPLGMGPALSALIFLLVLAVSLFKYLLYLYKEDANKIIDSIIDFIGGSFEKAIEVVVSVNVFTFTRSVVKEPLIDSVTHIVISTACAYYAIWIISIYAIDMVLYALSGYSALVLMTQNPWIVPILLLIAFALSQFVIPWKEEGEVQHSDTNSPQYFKELIRKFLSLEMPIFDPSEKSNISHLLVGPLLNALAFPLFEEVERPIVDYFHMPYAITKGGSNVVKKLLGDVLEDMLKENTIYGYRLIPLNKENCGQIPITKIPDLGSSCWYTVCKRQDQHDTARPDVQREGSCPARYRRVGYAMIVVYTDFEKLQTENHVKECLEKAEKSLERHDKTCKNIVSEIRKRYSASHDVLHILLIGQAEILGFKMQLIYPPRNSSSQRDP
ncbi:MAG: hypothetical protein ABWU84_07665 [Pyrobaculum sp.]|uniref:hypothetical protein n=1 Tax=Pyrobaculum sp. TaxID=2004705 RepID=UPI003EEBE295